MPWDLWTFLFGLVGALAVLGPPVLYLARRLKSLSMFTDPRLQHFLDDWFGEVARPGVPARPGAMERLAAVENDTRQLQRNGGSHMRDTVDRLEKMLEAREANVGTLARIEAALTAHTNNPVVNVVAATALPGSE